MNSSRSICLTGLALALAGLACTAVPSPGATFTALTETPTPNVVTTAADPGQPTAIAGSSGSVPSVSFEVACGAGSATLPSTAPTFADFASTILNTLNAHTSVDALNTGLRAWESITDKVGALDSTHDLNGDGAADLVVVVQAPPAQFPELDFPGPNGLPALHGDLYVYGCTDGKASLLFADYSTTARITPQLVKIGDLNADKIDDVVYTTGNCGASTCFLSPHVAAWSAPSQKVIRVFPEPYGVPSGKLELADVDGDGITEIILHVGMEGSAGAGVQRTFDETYAWTGGQYALKTRVVTSPQWPIHFLNDADDATASKDYATAIALYQQVIDDPNPKTFFNTDEIPALKAYARYRLMLAYALNGDTANAQTAHNALAADFTNEPAEAPGASFAHFADLFWAAYQPAHDVKAGCAPVIALASSNGASFEILNNFGYANSLYKPEDLCPAS